jgi:hypothetical protein
MLMIILSEVIIKLTFEDRVADVNLNDARNARQVR